MKLNKIQFTNEQKDWLAHAKRLTPKCNCEAVDKVEMIMNSDGTKEIKCGKCGTPMNCELVSYEQYRKDFGYPIKSMV